MTTTPDADKMTRDQLRAYAKEHSLAGYSKLNAPELREMVEAHQASLGRVNNDGPRPSVGVAALGAVGGIGLAVKAAQEAERDRLTDIQGRPVDVVLTVDTSPLRKLAQAMSDFAAAFGLAVVYDPWRPSAQAYTDSRTPDRKFEP